MEKEKEDIHSDNEVKQTSQKFGKVIEALHNKAKLSSLRTYQGDVAEFIKNKNESVVSIAVKEKEKKEERKAEEKKVELLPQTGKKKLEVNHVVILLSLLLIIGGAAGLFYVFGTLGKEPVNEVVIKKEIIPYNNLITLTGVTDANFQLKFKQLPLSNGVNIVEVTNADGLPLGKSKDFLSFLKISPPSSLARTLKDQYVVGVISRDTENYPFVIITVDDFGRAFSAMLDWEKDMLEDLSFLSTFSSRNTPVVSVPEDDSLPVVATSTSTTTTFVISSVTPTTGAVINVEIPMKPEVFSWTDIIVRNKDTRTLANEEKETKIAYTFLDKNTILITSSLSAIGDISSIYASRSIVR